MYVRIGLHSTQFMVIKDSSWLVPCPVYAIRDRMQQLNDCRSVGDSSKTSESWIQQLTDGNRDRMREMHKLNLSMCATVTRVGRDVSTIQRCVALWMQDHLQTRRKGITHIHNRVHCPADSPMAHLDPFAISCGVRSFLRTSMVASVYASKPSTIGWMIYGFANGNQPLEFR